MLGHREAPAAATVGCVGSGAATVWPVSVSVVYSTVCAHTAPGTRVKKDTTVPYSLIKQYSVRCQHMYCSYTVTAHYSITGTIEDNILAAVCPLGYESCVTPQ